MALARERIEILFENADEKASEGRKDLADRYVELARKIGMKSQETIPKKFKYNYCRDCDSFLRPGINSRKRLNSEREQIIYTCLECGNIHRYPLEDQK